MAHALDRHVALVGFMGAGKSTLGARGRERGSGAGSSISTASSSARPGDDPGALRAARRVEFRASRQARRSPRWSRASRRCSRSGAVRSRRRGSGARSASVRSTVLLDVDPDTAWERVARQRPAARAGRGASSAPLRASVSRSTTKSRIRRAATPTASCSPLAASHVEPGSLERLGGARRRRGRPRSSPTRTSLGYPRRRRAARARAARRDARAAAGRGGEERRRSSSGSGAAYGSTAAAPRRARRRLHDRRCGLRGRDVPARGRRGSRCRRRSSARSTLRSAGRRPSTCPRARISSAPSTGPSGR